MIELCHTPLNEKGAKKIGGEQNLPNIYMNNNSNWTELLSGWAIQNP